MAENIHLNKKSFAKHYEESILISASAENVFAYADDHAQLSSHMMQSSWMMGGGRMKTEIDEGGGKKLGSHIRMSGKAFWMNVSLDEVVTQYEPPYSKAWDTVGDVKLLVIGHYRMGFKVESQGDGSRFSVYIDYDMPSTNVWMGWLFGKSYAKWCVNQMINGVREHFVKK